MNPSPLKRYFTLPMMRAGFDFSGPSAGAGPTRETKARRALSGAQAGAETPCGRSVSLTGSPPSAGITWSWAFDLVSRSERKASHAPSGDQWGAVSRPGPVVKRRGSPPALSTVQMLERYSSRSSESIVTTNATRRPSGETRGSLTQRMRVMSAGVMARCDSVIAPFQGSYSPRAHRCWRHDDDRHASTGLSISGREARPVRAGRALHGSTGRGRTKLGQRGTARATPWLILFAHHTARRSAWIAGGGGAHARLEDALVRLAHRRASRS